MFSGGDSDLYAYVGGDPIKFIDPSGLDRLEAQNGTLTHYNDQGKVEGTYPYTSGRNGVKDPSVPWQGPIPPGDYSLDPKQISESGFLRKLANKLFTDWGDFRVPLTPSSSTETHGRGGFFLHGGKKPGSAGCIDIGGRDKDLFPKLKNHNGPIPLNVR